MNPPAHLLERLRCDVCRNYLSVAPVGRLGSASSCGRCDTGWPRNDEYEALAQLVSFPCLYCGDSARLAWGDVERHEARCRRDVVLCPGAPRPDDASIGFEVPRPAGEYHRECQSRSLACPFDGCESTVEARHVPRHFGRHHADHVFAGGVVTARKNMKEEKVWNFSPDSHVCLVVYESVPLLLFVHGACAHAEATGDIESYDYRFAVFSLCGDEAVAPRLRYDVTVRLDSPAAGGCATVALADQPVRRFDPRLHRVAYLRRGLVGLAGFDFMTSRFARLARTPGMRLCYELRLVVVAPERRALESLGPSVGTRSFECPICKEYMSPPVFNCHTGHSFCAACKARLVTCPYCRAVIGSSRNFALEEAIETLRVFCQNEANGCAFVGTVAEIKAHEPFCAYG